MDIYKDIYKDVKICPWCGADGGVSESLYKMIEGGEVVRCRSCGLVYAPVTHMTSSSVPILPH